MKLNYTDRNSLWSDQNRSRSGPLLENIWVVNKQTHAVERFTKYWLTTYNSGKQLIIDRSSFRLLLKRNNSPSLSQLFLTSLVNTIAFSFVVNRLITICPVSLVVSCVVPMDTPYWKVTPCGIIYQTFEVQMAELLRPRDKTNRQLILETSQAVV